MNTLGLDYYYKEHDVAGADEVMQVVKSFERRGMRALPKSHPVTFSNGSGSTYPDADLDHVFVAQHLQPHFSTRPDGSQVHVAGWAELSSQTKRDTWIQDFSDHTPLICTLNDPT